jgi:hypothetical protein
VLISQVVVLFAELRQREERRQKSFERSSSS